jgi:DNA helicase-2/ATP-dependent DNA helicase PcrA
MSRIDYAKELNAEQLAVVHEGDGPCLVLAGAGSGKTRTIIYRVAYLIEQGVNPGNILLLTFTNKAAGEMRKRLAELLGESRANGLWSGTFHSVANRLLRLHAPLVGFTSSFTILDTDDSKSLIKACIKECGLDNKSGGKRFPSPAVVREVVSYAQNAGIALLDALQLKYPNYLPLADDFSQVADRYRAKKIEANAMDFDDLLANLLELLDKDEHVRANLQDRFQHILVDEYQDTNFIQSAIVSRLAGGDRPNVLAVGDDAQSIYSFRAADIRNILDFPQHFPGTRIFKLTTNYRSTPQILDLANEVIAYNKEQFHKELSAIKKPAAKPRVKPMPSASREALYLADRLEQSLSDGVPASEIAVLFRATFHSQQLEFELMRRGVEYEYRGGLKFFERAHVKDVLAFLRVRLNPLDEASWRRLLLMQPGIGEVSAGKLFQAIRAAGNFATALALDVAALFSNKVSSGWRPLRQTLEALKGAKGEPADQIRAILKSPYLDYLEAEYPNFRERTEDLEQLATFAEKYKDCGDFLAEVSLDDSAYGKNANPTAEAYRQPKVVLSTVHQSKGLEWDTVFVMHLTATSFPNKNALMEDGGLEEERRLFYVAVTRAKRQLLLTHPATVGRDSFNYEGPSRFLEEISPASVEGGEAFAGGYDAGGFHEEPAIPARRPAGKLGSGQRGKRTSFLRDVSDEAYDYSDPGYDDSDEVVQLDADGEPVQADQMRQIRERVKQIKRGG